MADSWKNWGAFFTLGTINNLGYVVVLSAAKSLAASFNASRFLGLLNWADVGLGFLARAGNAYYTERLSTAARVNIAALLAVVGFVGLALAHHVGFWFALLSITLVGGSASWGESCLLGYLKGYPEALTGAWGSGTGMAGVGGSAAYIALVAAGVSDEGIFWLSVPTMVIYLAAFYCMLGPPQKSATKDLSVQLPSDDSGVDSDEPIEARVDVAGGYMRRTGSSSETATLLVAGHKVEVSGDGSTRTSQAPDVLDRGCARIRRCMGLVVFYGVNLATVYWAEYVISVGLAADAQGANSGKSSSIYVRNSYAILAFCYQFGVLISRSSLQIVRVRRIHLLTFAQLVMFALWLFIDVSDVFNGPTGVWVQFPLMVVVGLFGGCMYVNTFANLTVDPRIPERDRELCINIVAMWITAGIVAASLTDILLDFTVLATAHS